MVAANSINVCRQFWRRVAEWAVNSAAENQVDAAHMATWSKLRNRRAV
jgi:hypothetical protein